MGMSIDEFNRACELLPESVCWGDYVTPELVLQIAVRASTTAEPLVRYCPGCGSIGAVESKYRDCCPDGSDARMVPHKFAQQCRDTFKLAIAAIEKGKK